MVTGRIVFWYACFQCIGNWLFGLSRVCFLVKTFRMSNCVLLANCSQFKFSSLMKEFIHRLGVGGLSLKGEPPQLVGVFLAWSVMLLWWKILFRLVMKRRNSIWVRPSWNDWIIQASYQISGKLSNTQQYVFIWSYLFFKLWNGDDAAT